MDLFTTEDFSLFDIPGFNERMAAILLRIRPKLTTMGQEITPAVVSMVDLPLFKDEHDESPAALLKDMAPSDLASLSGELTRRRDGQFVLGRRLEASDVAGMKAKQFKKTALETFESLSPLFQLHDLRM